MNPSVGGVVGVGGGGVGGGIGVVGVGGGVGVPAAGPPPPAVATTPIMPVSGIPASPLPVGVGVGVSVGAASPVGTAMDSLSQALKANIIPNQEYLLQVSDFRFFLSNTYQVGRIIIYVIYENYRLFILFEFQY